MTPMEYSEGKLIHIKNLNSKISCQTPFNFYVMNKKLLHRWAHTNRNHFIIEPISNLYGFFSYTVIVFCGDFLCCLYNISYFNLVFL